LTASLSRSTADSLAEGVLAGDRAAAARSITWIENGETGADRLVKLLYPKSGRAHVVGVTGPPGVGKSTLLSALLAEARRRGQKVGALLVDPTSPYSGGALLGDRLRLSHDLENVFVRSLASRGRGGGLSDALWGARRVLDAMGLDTIFVETVGAGQADVDLARFADTVVVTLMPGLGDDIQALKAGILEIADILVVNKSDLPDGERTVAILKSFWRSAAAGRGWEGIVLPAAASLSRGVEALWEKILDHRSFLRKSGEGERRRRDQADEELMSYIRKEIGRAQPAARLAEHAEKLLRRESDPVSTARRLLSLGNNRNAKRKKR
jgi:LAO/AO transport system kinase